MKASRREERVVNTCGKGSLGQRFPTGAPSSTSRCAMPFWAGAAPHTLEQGGLTPASDSNAVPPTSAALRWSATFFPQPLPGQCAVG